MLRSNRRCVQTKFVLFVKALVVVLESCKFPDALHVESEN